MNIEEQIKIVKNMLLHAETQLLDYEAIAIGTLLTAYEKEKEKNKSIVYNYEMVVDKLENSTPNDKIKAIIEELAKQDRESILPHNYLVIPVLQSLLEKE